MYLSDYLMQCLILIRCVAVHLLRTNDVDSVCGVNVHVVAHKNLTAVPMKMAPMTKMPKTMMERKRFVDIINPRAKTN